MYPLPPGPPVILTGVPRKKPHRCKRCGAWDHEGAVISARGLCARCADRAVIENTRALQTGEGAAFEHWKRSVADGRIAAARQVLTDAAKPADVDTRRPASP